MKKLLLIGLSYHRYTSDIAAEIERLGYQVNFHNIQPRTFVYQAARIVAPAYYQRMLDRHHEKILAAEANHRYDVVLFIQVHQMARRNLEALRARQSGARFVLYNWDAITTHDYRPNMDVFDAVFTFDPDDAKALGINYLPLFCSRSYQMTDRSRQDRNAVYFLGNIVNVKRYVAVRAFIEYCRRRNIAFHHYMVCSPVVFAQLLLAGIVPRGMKFSPIKPDALVKLVETSSAVFDFANHHQAGYTMRTVENFCAGKKLITNNHRIAAEPFYSDDRILVFSGLDFAPVEEFLTRDVTSPEAAFEEFKIQNFVRRLVG